jgi:outer membrane receptor for ferrienterochelin and colicins
MRLFTSYETRLVASLAPFCLLIANDVLAQESAPAPQVISQATQSIQRAEVSGAKDVDDQRTSTAAKFVVTRDDMTRYGDSNLGDVLRRVPGITIQGGQGKGGEIRMRGLGSGYTQILINGEPTAPGFSFESMSPSLIERIEVSRVATADMSAQAIAGTINIILKQTVRAGQREIKASAGGYAGNPSLHVNGQISDRLGALSYTLAGGLSSEKTTSPAILDQTGRDAQGNINSIRTTAETETFQNDALSLTPRLNWKRDNGDVVSAESLLILRHIDFGAVDTRITTFGAPPLYSGNDLKTDMDFTILRTKLNWTRKLANNAKLDAKVGTNYVHKNSAAKYFGFDQARNVILDEDTTSRATDKSLSASGKYRTPYVADHSIAIGWDGEYSERAEDRLQRQTAPTGYPALNLDEIYDASVSRLALYAQDEWDITPRWSIYYGLRWEGLQTRSAGNVMVAEVKNRSSVFTPVFQTLWKLPDSKNDQVRLGLSRTYKAPMVRELMPRRFAAYDNTSTTPDTQGNADLRQHSVELVQRAHLAQTHFRSLRTMEARPNNPAPRSRL